MDVTSLPKLFFWPKKIWLFLRYYFAQHGYIILYEDNSFIYMKNNNIKVVKKTKICSVRKGIDRYIDKAYWSGSEVIREDDIFPKNNNHRVVFTKKSLWYQIFEIYLGEALNIGDTVEIEFEINLTDLKNTHTPIFVRNIETWEFIKNLKITIQYEDPIKNIKSLKCFSCLPAEVKNSKGKSPTVQESNQNFYTKTQIKPKTNHVYGLLWEKY